MRLMCHVGVYFTVFFCVSFQKSNPTPGPQRFVELYVVVDNAEVITSHFK